MDSISALKMSKEASIPSQEKAESFLKHSRREAKHETKKTRSHTAMGIKPQVSQGKDESPNKGPSKRKNLNQATNAGLKLNLDLEELKPKYDIVFPQIFRALDHVMEPHVRGQFECLLSDVYETFLQPELEDQKTDQPSPFLDMVQKFLQHPTATKKKNAFEAIKMRRWNIKAVAKLKQAKALQKQVEGLRMYFEERLSFLDNAEKHREYATQRRRSKSCNLLSTTATTEKATATTMSAAKGVSPETIAVARDATFTVITAANTETPSAAAAVTKSTPTVIATEETTEPFETATDDSLALDARLNQTKNCTSGKLAEQPSATTSSSEPVGRVATQENSLFVTKASSEHPIPVEALLGNAERIYLKDIEMVNSDRMEKLISETKLYKLAGKETRSRVEMSEEKERKSDEKEAPLSEIKRSQSQRDCAREIKKMKWFAEGVADFQLNLPPRLLRDSSTLVVKSKGAFNQSSCPCRKAVDSFARGSSMVELTEDGVIGSSSEKMRNAGSTSMGSEGDGSGSGGQHLAGGVSLARGRSARINRTDLPKIGSLVDRVKSLGFSIQDRKMRIGLLKQSNAILTEQIAEVESTLESFDNYLNTVKLKPYPAPPDALRREMYTFQEAMMERIFTCIELLSSQMKALRKTEQTKASKVKAMLSKYETTKKETPDALVIVGGVGRALDSMLSLSPSAKIATSNELRQGLRTVVKGIEFFQASCEDIWDETMNRIFSELEVLFASLPSPPSQRWSPDEPGSSPCVSQSPSDSLEADIESTRVLPGDKSKYGSVLVFSLRMLERVSSEFGHLMVLTRIKDMQILSVDHSIGLAYVSMKQMVMPRILSNSGSQSRRSKKKKKNMKTCPNDSKGNFPSGKRDRLIEVCKGTGEDVKLGPAELLQHEKELERKLRTDTNVDKRQLKRRPWDGREAQGASTEARSANKAVLARQLQTDNAQHMGSVTDMKLPLIGLHQQSAFLLDAETGAKLVSTSRTDGISPWTHLKGTAAPDNTTDGPKDTSAQIQANDPSSPKARRKLPKILSAQNSNMSKPPATPNAAGRNLFIRGTMVLQNETNQKLDYMSSRVEKREIHRPIQYCRVLAMPTPPSANLIVNQISPEESRKTQDRHASKYNTGHET